MKSYKYTPTVIIYCDGLVVVNIKFIKSFLDNSLLELNELDIIDINNELKEAYALDTIHADNGYYNPMLDEQSYYIEKYEITVSELDCFNRFYSFPLEARKVLLNFINYKFKCSLTNGKNIIVVK